MTYEEIAAINELDERTSERFIRYMRARWGDPDDEHIKCLCGYASEWAMRFADGVEWRCSNLEGQRILREMENGR